MNNKQIINFINFKDVTLSYNIEISNKQLDLFKRYYDFLLEWNKKINLISRREENILEKHFLDSILFLPEIEDLLNQAPAVLDIGSGGGFPAIPLAIMKQEWQFTLCESIKKKVNFLNELIKHLELKNVSVINARVETCQKKFNFVTARAVDKLNVLIKYSLPLLKEGGFLLAFKSKDIEEEIKETEKIIKKNNLKLKIYSKEINNIERKLVVLQN